MLRRWSNFLSGLSRKVGGMAVPFKVFRVMGQSMEPTLFSGDLLVVKTGETKTRDIVVLREPGGDWAVKRQLSEGAETISVGSDNPWVGIDSRHYGSVSTAAVVGRVCFTPASNCRALRKTIRSAFERVKP